MCIFDCYWDDFLFSTLLFLSVVLHVFFANYTLKNKWLRIIFVVGCSVYYSGVLISSKPVALKVFVTLQVATIIIAWIFRMVLKKKRV